MTPLPDGPLIPRPEPVPAALRAAVAEIAPGRLPALTRHLFEAATHAHRTRSLAPLRAFSHSWAVFVAIERHPRRAARLRELEDLIATGERDPAAALAEIRRILVTAEAEAGLPSAPPPG
ncbi:hypothetical protein GCM10018785_60790 [Streptomyces longispororuber]|uniref:Uncharacterized protein n=1 Tax=Streptomyces longispororuber TaxID=68230 RepID=A0A919A487_9ACTN|nr:hypothetical protein [Streptomyces longispororuber]GHE84667.1 hypothetical protein GCM10018785_60790 [Streptomyces longispororuber]